jgi:hypothetical protein
MTKLSKQTLSQALSWQAEILQPILAEYSHIKVTHLNYYYIDWQQQIASFIGTEADWLQYCVGQRLVDDLPSRLHSVVNPWATDSDWNQHYQQYLEQQQFSSKFLKTDICLEGQNGYHLLEIAHERPLTLYEINSLFECVSVLKDENKRLQKQHPDLIMNINKSIVAPKPAKPPMTTFVDLNQIEEADPIALDRMETAALTLRLQGYCDDEIAPQLQLDLSDIRQLFASIADKQHQPYIPTSVYQRHLQLAWQDFTHHAHSD